MEQETLKQLCKSLDKLSTNDVLRWTIFLNECMDPNVGKERLLGMINILLEHAQEAPPKGKIALSG